MSMRAWTVIAGGMLAALAPAPNVAAAAQSSVEPARSPRQRPQQGRGQLFISPMGEPFRSTQKAGAAQALWFQGADRDGDGRITRAEFQADATRVFAHFDRGRDGEIDPEDIAWYENILVPEIRVRGGGRGGSAGRPDTGSGKRGSAASRRTSTADATLRIGAGRFGLFDLPEPVTSADLDFNRGVDRAEFAKAAADRFAALDRNGDGAIRRREVPRAGGDTWRNGDDQLGTAPLTPAR